MILDTIDVASLSEAGPRTRNEDSILAASLGPASFVIGVADGLGGHEGGKNASRFAVNSLLEKLQAEGSFRSLKDIVSDIHLELRVSQQHASLPGMATTLSAAVISSLNMKFVHCGDTRISIARENGIRRLTVDHSEAQRLFDAGKLSRAQFATYPRKNILESALGIHGDPRIDEGEFHLQRGDKIFITSDGLHTKILLRELFYIARRSSTAQRIADDVGSEMQLRGADDNYSFVCALIN
jgi:protein phosphatase